MKIGFMLFGSNVIVLTIYLPFILLSLFIFTALYSFLCLFVCLVVSTNYFLSFLHIKVYSPAELNVNYPTTKQLWLISLCFIRWEHFIVTLPFDFSLATVEFFVNHPTQRSHSIVASSLSKYTVNLTVIS